MKKDIAIVFGITKDYTFALANVLIGMKKYCRTFWDDIIVYHDGINEMEQLALSSILPCVFIHFDESLFNENAIHTEGLKNYSLLTLARFECFGLLEKYHKVIWNDVDILIQNDFSSLLEYGDKSGYAATQSPTFRMEQNFFGLMPGYDMLSLLYNAGILVLSDRLPNPAELRIYCYNTFNKYASKLRYNDQSVLNMMIQDFEINVEIINIEQYCCHPDTPTYKDAAIIHAYGYGKFWNSDRLERQFPEWQENDQKWLKIKEQFCPKKQNGPPEISVLMSIYERTDYMSEAIHSILDQTLTDFEFIIVVEKSPVQDQTCVELNKIQDNRIIIVKNKSKLGFSASLNVGIDLARGKYIARMDDDDISLPNRLQKEVRFLESHPDVSVVGSWIQIFGREEKEEHRPETHEELTIWAIKENPMFHPTVMIRKADMDRYSFRYDPAFLTEDYDLWTRMMDKLKFANIPEILLHFRASNQNATVTKQQEVLQCHLDIMRRTLYNNLHLTFSRDEMLLLRQPSIIYECYNSDDMAQLRDSVLKQIYDANMELNVYNQQILEQLLGKIKLDFKTKAKVQLKDYPGLYQKLRCLYRAITRKDNQIPKKPQDKSFLDRLKMRLLPPSSRSFHNRMNRLEEQLNWQKDLLWRQNEELRIQSQQLSWIDNLNRRIIQENNAGFFGLNYILHKGVENVGYYLNNEQYRLITYREVVSAMHIFRPLHQQLGFNSIVDFKCNTGAWLYAAKTLGIQYMLGIDTEIIEKNRLLLDENEIIKQNIEDEIQLERKYDLSLALRMPWAMEGSVIKKVVNNLCTASDLVLFSFFNKDYSENDDGEDEKIIKMWIDKFASHGFLYMDIRPLFKDDWEILYEYRRTIGLFVAADCFYKVKKQLADFSKVKTDV